MALHTAAAQRPGPLTAAFLVSHRPAAALGLCLGSFHHREGSSVDCSLISFRSSFKILFSGAFLADSASFSGVRALRTAILLRSPVAWLPDWTQVISPVITADSVPEATRKC